MPKSTRVSNSPRSLVREAEGVLEEATRRIKGSRAIDHWQDGREEDDAAQLLAHVLDIDYEDEIDPEIKVTSAQYRRYRAMIDRRVKGEPVALITGFFEFMDLHLNTRPGVFIPRWSSELLANKAIALTRRRSAPVAVDVCTGSGPVALAMADRIRNAKVYGLDISSEAVSLGRANAKRLGLKNINFLAGDFLKPLPSKVRGKVCTFTMHPPYVAKHEVRTLPKEIRAFEPKHTLTDQSKDGLGFVRQLAEEAPIWLCQGGRVIIEIGPHLSRQVATIFRRAGYRDIKTFRDDVGATRVIVSRWS